MKIVASQPSGLPLPQGRYGSPDHMIAVLFSLLVGNAALGQTFDLSTDYLFFPLNLQVNADSYEVRSLRVTGEITSSEEATGTLTLDTRSGQPNEFGDVPSRADGESVVLPVRFRGFSPVSRMGERIPRAPGISEGGPGRASYEIVFPEHDVDPKFDLVVGWESYLAHHLKVWTKVESAGFPAGTRIRSILPLSGTPNVQTLIPSEPISGTVQFRGYYTIAREELRNLRIEGRLQGAGRLHIDPNLIHKERFGEGGGITAMGYRPHEVRIERVELEDPSGRGRRLYEVVPDDPVNRNRCFLVLGRADDSPDHRLLLYRGDTIWTSVPLEDEAWLQRLRNASGSENLSERERHGVSLLTERLGGGFQSTQRDGHLIELRIGKRDPFPDLSDVWPFLTHLEELTLSGCDLRGVGLRGLSSSPMLTSFFMSEGFLDWEVCLDISRVVSLEMIGFHQTSGVTDSTIVSLEELPRLSRFRLYQEIFGREPDWKQHVLTDQGLERMGLLPSMRHMELWGQDLTDRSLERLAGFSQLEELVIAGEGITDAGLVHILKYPALQILHLKNTQVTETGLQWLREQRPGLEVDSENFDPNGQG